MRRPLSDDLVVIFTWGLPQVPAFRASAYHVLIFSSEARVSGLGASRTVGTQSLPDIDVELLSSAWPWARGRTALHVHSDKG